jgi:hypothetical protein
MADYKDTVRKEFADVLKRKKDTDEKVELAENRYDSVNANSAGAGRGKQGGPTAEELNKYQKGGAAKKTTTFKKGGKEELQKALQKLEQEHRGGSLGGN